MSDQEPVPRVRVTGPRGNRPRPMSPASQIDAQTEVGDLYMRTLVRSQLRLALVIAAALAVTVGSLPLLFWLFPTIGETRVSGIPVPWLVLGGGVYPVLIGLARIYVRRAERNETAFDDLIKPT